eukprot:TRINITY_DN11175_c0_g1_i2.p1 TRINITY_DN11175_c0_g1~~TRINITY_DN11175_c0_g1_i2.p1  ORF type:complete len:389 (+),score=50.68 TRINITY_DN11175_c0_g1_i2:65-1168(+)
MGEAITPPPVSQVPVPPQKQPIKPPVVPSATANPLWKQPYITTSAHTPPSPPSKGSSTTSTVDNFTPPTPTVQGKQDSGGWQRGTDGSLPMCPLDRLCDSINDPFHHNQFRHTCKIKNCELADQEWHNRLFVHTEASPPVDDGNIIVYNTENFSYVALQGNWAKVKIAKIREKISIHLNIPVDQQMLTTKAGHVLDDPSQSCKEAGISNGKTLFVTRMPVGHDQASFLHMNVNARPFYPYIPTQSLPQATPQPTLPQQPIPPFITPMHHHPSAQPVMATPIGTPVGNHPVSIQQPHHPLQQHQHHQYQHPQMVYPTVGATVVQGVVEKKQPQGKSDMRVDDNEDGIVWSDEVPNESGYEDQLFHIGY